MAPLGILFILSVSTIYSIDESGEAAWRATCSRNRLGESGFKGADLADALICLRLGLPRRVGAMSLRPRSKSGIEEKESSESGFGDMGAAVRVAKSSFNAW